MTSTESIIDRRQHKRYVLDSGGFTLIQANDKEVIGTIKNISAGGLSLSHFSFLQITSYFLNPGTSHTPAQAAGCAETSRHEGC